MSKLPGQDKDQDDSAKKPPPYEVGYGKPPVEHQFPKGKTGNKRGRPKKKMMEMGGKPLFSPGYGLQLANFLLLEEAYRLVAIREGDQIIEIPAIQAVVRAMGVSAIKGDRFAQRNLFELVERGESSDRELRRECEKTVREYKANWTDAIAKARAAGRPEPQPLPHPDDLIIDHKTGNIVVCGPASEEERRRWDGLIKRRAGSQEEVSYCAREWRKARAPRRKAMWANAGLPEQKIFDIINDNLPLRYRVELKDRSYAKGASRAGSERRVEWPEG